MSQNSYGPKKFQFGPRRNVPRITSKIQRIRKPKRNVVISHRRSLIVKYPFPFGFVSMYGIAMRPTMIRPGNTTPANHGSKYTSISCRPRKYHGALEGFGELDGFAGSSSGACRAIDHPIKMTVKTTMQMSSV